MSRSYELGRQRDPRIGIVAELAAAGFDDAEEIGRAEFGAVYRCSEHALDRLVAVKVLTSEVHGDERERFMREQRALGRLSGHPHVVEILRVDMTATGKPFIVMPFYPLGSLEKQLQVAGPFYWREVLSIAVKLSGALAVGHASHIVHRDVKPANILFTDYGQPLLTDFGIAGPGGEWGASGPFAGTPAFAAPEVLDGATPQPASDIYSLGATLFCLLTGHPPTATAPAVGTAELGVPPEMSAAIGQAMAIDPADRWQSVVEFGEHCRGLQRRFGQNIDTMALPVATLRQRPPAATADNQIVPEGHIEEGTGGQAPPTASTRFRPPSSVGSLVPRPRLLQLLDQGRPRRLTLIHAPAGFGKTTLAAQWCRSLESTGMSTTWLTVDADDNNAVWFLIHLVETIRRVRPELAQDLRAILEERSGGSIRYVITTLIDEIHNSGEPIVAVVDNWDRVTSQASIDAMAYLIEHGCHHLGLVVTSRSSVGLPLTTMSAADEVVEIDSTALRFDTEEARSFLVEIKRLPLAAPDVAMVQQSTQGWVAALQLASLSLRSRHDPAEFIGRLSAHHQRIGDYLTENVLNQVDAALLDFLLATCITDRICADLATALSGLPRGRDMLQRVCRQDLFLRRVEDDDTGLEWFRYHPLFADCLRHRLARQDPARSIRLHRVASAWFVDHGLLNEALDHALDAGQPDRAMLLVLDNAIELFESSRQATLLGLVAKLPHATATANPQLQLFVALANLTLQRHAQTRAALDHAEAALDTDTCDRQMSAQLRVQAAVVRTTEQFYLDRFSPLPELLTAHLDDDVTSMAANVLANDASIEAVNRFDFDEARRRQQAAATYHRHSKGPLTVMLGHYIAGLAAYEQLDIAAAEISFRTAYMLSIRSGAHSYAARVASAPLGGLLYQQGRLDDAEALLDQGFERGDESGPPEFLLVAYGIGARIKAVRGNLAAAARRLEEGAKIAENLSLPRLAACMVNERVRCGLPITRDERIRLLWLRPYQRNRDGTKAITAEFEQDSAIRLLLAENTRTAAEGACARAECVVREIATQNRPRALLQAQLTRATCMFTAGRVHAACSSLGASLAQCADHDLSRFVIDCGPAMGPLVAAFQDNPGPPGRLPPIFMRKVAMGFGELDRHAGGVIDEHR